MKNKLTYKIQYILLKNEYREVKIESKIEGRGVNIKNARTYLFVIYLPKRK